MSNLTKPKFGSELRVNFRIVFKATRWLWIGFIISFLVCTIAMSEFEYYYLLNSSSDIVKVQERIAEIDQKLDKLGEKKESINCYTYSDIKLYKIVEDVKTILSLMEERSIIVKQNQDILYTLGASEEFLRINVYEQAIEMAFKSASAVGFSDKTPRSIVGKLCAWLLGVQGLLTYGVLTGLATTVFYKTFVD